ncbi:MAG TPA: LLM class F420-dependent oxidoreductase [Nocardia sp.]|uniref:LLM class F420-dependent oxidoreductase n=1 Tax=Nocardia TaxID=1817 RepID=UPI002457381A|nr:MULTISPECIES: LLM class F420-dependent oxidoreductase [Nocardia]HLS78286.1 LLM class F420-dependent oxidoreductase [Nocardia sp.]
MTEYGLGRFGVWRGYKGFQPEEAAELEELGYGALWLGGSPPAALETVEPLLAATERLTVATSIVNIWTAPVAELAASFHRIENRYPGRFLLGIGVGHPEAVDAYRKPYGALVEYLDKLDAAGVPRSRRAVAALGPRVLELARDRALGALPYLGTPEHTRRARAVVGARSLLAVEQKLVVDDDPGRARSIGRPMVARYLGLANYVNNLRRLGYEESDFAGEGSDRLIDALAVHGTARRVAEQVSAHLDAGADHVALQALGEDYLTPLRELAPLLTR